MRYRLFIGRAPQLRGSGCIIRNVNPGKGSAGIAYVAFMVNNPDYFNYMFSGGIKKTPAPSSSFTEALAAFRRISVHYLESTELEPEEYDITMLAMRGMVQWLASLL